MDAREAPPEGLHRLPHALLALPIGDVRLGLPEFVLEDFQLLLQSLPALGGRAVLGDEGRQLGLQGVAL